MTCVGSHGTSLGSLAQYVGIHDYISGESGFSDSCSIAGASSRERRELTFALGIVVLQVSRSVM